MKVLVTGASGQLGSDVIEVLHKKGHYGYGVSRKDADLGRNNSLPAIIRSIKPDVVVHCAAYTDVERAEIEPELCRLINVEGTARIAEACKDIQARLLYISTDYIFSGSSAEPYEIDAPTAPLSVYGSSKLEGEQKVRELLESYYIIRTSWAFGINGSNFISKILQLGLTNPEMSVVDDQVGSPTYTEDLARLICDMLCTDNYGVYHATNEGFCSRAELAIETFRHVGYDTIVKPISTSESFFRARRPLNSKLSKSSLDSAGFDRLPHWKDALHRYLSKKGIPQ
jgi:dTDP-4-dehydrorhamnose reductase